MYENYKEKGLEILGFPCNQFGGQEPGTNEEIKKFATEKYHVTFPLFDKVDVNGENAHPVFKFLKEQQKTTVFGIPVMTDILWNFEKFLVDRKGHVVKRYKSITSPLSIEPDIVELLQQEDKEKEQKF